MNKTAEQKAAQHDALFNLGAESMAHTPTPVEQALIMNRLALLEISASLDSLTTALLNIADKAMEVEP